MIQTDISGSAGGSATSPLGGSSSGGGFTPDPNHPDYFQFFQTTQNCLDFNTYTPGVVQYVVNIACTPPFLDSPFGEIADLGAMYAQNDAYISMIGPSIPVLLTSARRTRPIRRPRPTPTTPTTRPTAAATSRRCCCRTPRTCSWSTGRCRPGSMTSSIGCPRTASRPRAEPRRAGRRILVTWSACSARTRRPPRERPRRCPTRRWPRGCGRTRSTSSSARTGCWRRDRRCAARSRRATPTR